MKQEAFAHEELKVEFSENGDEATIIEEFTYGVDDKNYVVPIGFVTDFASVPRFAQIIVLSAIVLLSLAFPLACEVGYYTSKIWNFKYMDGAGSTKRCSMGYP